MKNKQNNSIFINIFSHINKYSEKKALISANESLTYEALIKRSSKIIINSDQSLYLIICTNSLASIVGYVGIVRSNNVALLMNDTNNKKNYQRLTIAYKPKFIFCPDKYEKTFLKMNYSKLLFDENYILFINNNHVNYKLHPQLSILLGTSGSTGSPKYVRLTHQNLMSNTNSIIDSLKIISEDRTITTMPMGYSYGLSIINSHLAKGASVIITDKSINEKDFWSIFNKYEVTSFGGVPFIYDMLLKLRFEKMKLSSLRYITQAGGKLEENKILEIYNACKKNNINFFTMYGQTEASPRMSVLDFKYLPDKIGSIGKPIKDGKFILIDNNGNKILNSHRIGELVYEGNNVCLGYAEGYIDLFKGDKNKGILRTEDYAKFDEEGFYYIVGRKKRIIKIYGNRINLDDVEKELYAMKYVCACTGNDDNLKIFFEGKHNKNTLRKIINDIIDIKNDKLQIFDKVIIPRTSSGKIDYKILNKII